MIKIFVKEEDGKISYLKITGHAGYQNKGKDIVCAAVSAIGIGTLNALDQYCAKDCKLKLEDDLIEIQVINESTSSDWIMRTCFIQLKSVAEDYSSYIRITKGD